MALRSLHDAPPSWGARGWSGPVAPQRAPTPVARRADELWAATAHAQAAPQLGLGAIAAFMGPWMNAGMPSPMWLQRMLGSAHSDQPLFRETDSGTSIEHPSELSAELATDADNGADNVASR
jgi:hypothetical protein